MATRDLGRLAKRVTAHRLELYPARLAAARAAGISKDTWKRVETGLPVLDVKYRQIDRALGWAGGSCVAIAEGGEPVEVDYVESGGDVTMVSAFPDVWSEDFEEFVRQAMAETAMATSPGTPIGEIRAMSDRFVEILRKRASSQKPQ